MPVAIMLDTKGPEIRIGKIPAGELAVHAGMWLKLVAKTDGDSLQIPVQPFDVLEAIQPGMAVLFDDGYIGSKIIECHKHEIIVEIQSSGILKSGKKSTFLMGI
jgi:pyruvate kinase